MRACERFHPTVLSVWLLSLLVFTMFAADPILPALSLPGGAAFYLSLVGGRRFLRELSFIIPLFFLISITNPLFSHRGMTPLFFLNGNPVTLEAVLAGVHIALTLTAALLWCRCAGELLTSDKLLYLFGGAIPKLSLLLSMSLRFLPLFRRKWREIREAQTALGYFRERGIVNRLTSSARVFSALVGWALENAMQTSVSMKARGYGLPGRTRFALFRFTASDGCLLALCLLFATGTAFGFASGALDFSFYPRLTVLSLTPPVILSGAAFGILSFCPVLFEIKEALRWKF